MKPKTATPCNDTRGKVKAIITGGKVAMRNFKKHLLTNNTEKIKEQLERGSIKYIQK